MTVDTSTAQELAGIALQVAREAGRLVMDGYRTKVSVKHKRPRDLVTEYDVRSEDLIRERLSARTPELAFVGEEGGGFAGDGPAWYVDPIDGTTNYAHGHPMWCVSLGVMDGDLPVAGAVVAPALGVEWSGFKDGPARRNDELIEVSEIANLEDALLATGFPPDRSRAPENNFATFQHVKMHVGAVRRCGAAALDMCFVAEGTYEGYWERRVHAWDLVGGAAVVLSAGGRITALDASPAKLTEGNVLATNGLLHDAMVELVSR